MLKKLSCFLGVSSLVVFSAVPAQAYEAGDFILRGGVADVMPQDSSSPSIVTVKGNMQLGITGTYMATKNIGIELLASTPFTHDVNLKATGNTIAEVEQLPPTVSAQYYFDTGTVATPYVGLGVNYFLVLRSEMTSYGRATLATNQINVDDSVGLAYSAGVDVKLTDRLIFNAAVWKIDVDTTATIGGTTKVDIQVDPWVGMVAVGYKF